MRGRRILVIFLLILLGGIVFASHRTVPVKEFSANIVDALPTPAPMPTEINANFLTQVNECFISVAAVYGYTLRIASGFRTTDEQAELYEQGRTEDGHIVSWAPEGKSIHNYGYAVDVVDRWRGYNINWKKLAKIGEYCGLAQVDDPHFEYRGGLATEQFEAGLRPPPIMLPCTIMGERASTGKPLTRQDLKNCGAPLFQ